MAAETMPVNATPALRTPSEKTDIPESEQGAQSQDEIIEVYPSGPALTAISIGLFLAILCFGLDRSILATAIPKITSEFNSLSDVAWYGSAYLFTQCSFQLLFGKLYAEYSIKRIFLIGLAIFEVGSVVCAAAPNSVVLIVGRAVSGVGAAGLMTGALIIIAKSVPLHKRPTFTAAIGAAAGVSQVIAPTLGGVFVDKATWSMILAAIIWAKKESRGFKEFMDNFDLVGTLLLIPWVICLLLALQWGGTEYAWSNWSIILCWCIFALCFLLWGFVQYREGDKATVPLRIMSQRTMIASCWTILLLFSLLFIDVYYIPIWLQAVKNHSAYKSGIDLLASSASMSVATIVSGILTSQIGYYVPQIIASSVISSVAGGLIYSFTVDTDTAFWAASLVLMGLGVGLGGQQCIIAAQTVFKGRDIALATSVLVFLQSLGGTVFLAVAQNVFSSRLVAELRRNVPNVNPAVVINAGASGLVDSMRKTYPDSVDGIIESYNRALQNVFLIATVLGCLTALGIGFFEWKSVKENKPKTDVKSQTDGDTEK
ncbi:Efflux pump aflT [Colletotrichum sp. SAR 10_70]|nr:Efflux pump aflT [Colletotrichum sp. SAR 10_71]KAI8196610.1 Efflux pump aflT [Colletotrichum sp. SAR 10_70]